MRWIEPLTCGAYYHIYNQGINGESLFSDPGNYQTFLDKYDRYLRPVVDTLAYSLNRNHFHLLVYIRPSANTAADPSAVSRQFGHFFNAYAQAFNRQRGRTGGLFESPFRRRQLRGARAITDTFCLIHRDPQDQGSIKDFRKWPHSSYRACLDGKKGILSGNGMRDWFGTPDAFVQFHEKSASRPVRNSDPQTAALVPVLGK